MDLNRDSSEFIACFAARIWPTLKTSALNLVPAATPTLVMIRHEAW